MIITCPECRTRFQVKAASLGAGGRTVRCSACGHRWRATAAAEPDDGIPPPIPPAAPGKVPPEAATPRAPVEKALPTPLSAAPLADGDAPAALGGHGLVGWLVLALVALLLVALVVGRDQVVAALPQAAPIYQRLGLPVDLSLGGLEFRNLQTSRHEEGTGAASETVSGEIHNVAGRDLPVPKLRVALLDERHEEIRSALFDPPQQALPPGGMTQFELTLPDLPPEARDARITFADRP